MCVETGTCGGRGTTWEVVTLVLRGGDGGGGEEQIRRMKSKGPITKSASSLKCFNQEKCSEFKKLHLTTNRKGFLEC